MGIVLAMDPRNAGSNPAEDGFLRAIKISSTTSFGGEVRPSPHVVRFYGTLENHTGMKRDTCVLNSRTFLAKFLPASLQGLSCNHSRELWLMNRNSLEFIREHNTSINDGSCMGRFVRYQPVTVTSKTSL
jgi:hypothetical protein